MSKNGKPQNQNTGDQQRSITGELHVRGEISVEPSPTEIFARKTYEEKKKTADRKKRHLEVASFWVLVAYATLTAWQSFNTQRIANLTKDQFTKDQRPYVWIGKPIFELAGDQLNGSIGLKNVGKSPAMNIHVVGQMFAKGDFKLVEIYFLHIHSVQFD